LIGRFFVSSEDFLSNENIQWFIKYSNFNLNDLEKLTASGA